MLNDERSRYAFLSLSLSLVTFTPTVGRRGKNIVRLSSQRVYRGNRRKRERERERERTRLKRLTKGKSKNAGAQFLDESSNGSRGTRACTETSSCQCDRMPLSEGWWWRWWRRRRVRQRRMRHVNVYTTRILLIRTRTHSKKARKFRRRIDRLINSTDPEALIRHRRNIASSPRRKTNIRNATPAAA